MAMSAVREDNYSIALPYKCNLQTDGEAVPFVGRIQEAGSWQVPVYEYAREIIAKRRLRNVVDVGCDWGVKLQKYINPVCRDIVGIDYWEEKIRYCQETYNFGEWLLDDIEQPSLKMERTFDLIIASDVIEHLVDPDQLLHYLRRFARAESYVIFSTPDKSKGGQALSGPPRNKTHVREWTKDEFGRYLSSRGLLVERHFLTAKKGYGYFKGLFMKLKDRRRCQVVLCKFA